ncbi:hypothetical protein HPB47_025517, partial [Ixodes persulcatus]
MPFGVTAMTFLRCRAVQAALCHMSSADESSDHGLRPKGASSCCFYNRALANDERPVAQECPHRLCSRSTGTTASIFNQGVRKTNESVAGSLGYTAGTALIKKSIEKDSRRLHKAKKELSNGASVKERLSTRHGADTDKECSPGFSESQRPWFTSSSNETEAAGQDRLSALDELARRLEEDQTKEAEAGRVLMASDSLLERICGRPPGSRQPYESFITASRRLPLSGDNRGLPPVSSDEVDSQVLRIVSRSPDALDPEPRSAPA